MSRFLMACLVCLATMALACSRGDGNPQEVEISDGEDGRAGADGKSCAAEPTPSGAVITCEGQDPIIIKNGEDGRAGSRGPAGPSGGGQPGEPGRDGNDGRDGQDAEP